MKSLQLLRLAALLEGASFLVLLSIAMPLKYFGNTPIAVTIAGSIHGALFLFFLFTLIQATTDHHWPRRRVLLAFLASVIPFAAFALARSLQQEIEATSDAGE